MWNVIFLDIDGVMNSEFFYRERHKRRWTKFKTYKFLVRKWYRNIFIKKENRYKMRETPDIYYTFDYQFKRLKEETCPQKWKWLSEFCNETNTKICISSVWKNHFGDKKNVYPEWWGKALEKLGFNENIFVDITGEGRTLRGQEIKEWLDQNKHWVNDYAILDDDSDMLEEQFIKFHHCDRYYGLTPGHLYRIDRQFTEGNEYSRLSKSFQNKLT